MALMSSRHLLNIKLMFILFNSIVNSVFISDEFIISSVIFWLLLWALCAPSHIIVMVALKTKAKSRTKTNHKKHYRKTNWSKTHMWIKPCFHYKLNCCNNSKMFSVAVYWWKSSGAPAAGMEVESHGLLTSCSASEKHQPGLEGPLG